MIKSKQYTSRDESTSAFNSSVSNLTHNFNFGYYILIRAGTGSYYFAI